MKLRHRLYNATTTAHRVVTHPLVMLATTIALVWGLFRALPPDTARKVDPYLLLFMGFGFLFCVVVVSIRTRQWTPRSLGILAEHFAGAVLYTSSGLSRFQGVTNSRDVLDLSRASFFVAVSLLVGGLLVLIRRKAPDPADDAPKGSAT